MKRVLTVLLSLSVLAVSLAAVISVVGSAVRTLNIEVSFPGIRVEVDGQPVDLKDANGEPLEPFIYGGSTYIPARAVSEALGYEVIWDGTTNTVKINTPSASPYSNAELDALGEVIPSGECVRFSVSGRVNASWLGTITYADPKTGVFAALSHSETYLGAGAIMTDAVITGVQKGKTLTAARTLDHKFSGMVIYAGIEGAFGSFDEPPVFARESVGFAWPEAGAAEMLVETGPGGVKVYKVKITKVAANAVAPENKDFAECDVVFEITDEALLEITGGSVSGMSGCPIIQNGRLVAALTGRSSSNTAVCYGISAADMRTRQLTAANGR